jgi:hypothetical protein
MIVSGIPYYYSHSKQMKSMQPEEIQRTQESLKFCSTISTVPAKNAAGQPKARLAAMASGIT